MTPQTVVRWQKEGGGLRVDQAKRMKELEADNALETAELVRNQILQQSQVAVMYQANIQMQRFLLPLKDE